MNTHFSIRRFGLLFKRHLAENMRSYLMSYIVLTGLLALLMGIAAYYQYQPMRPDVQFFFYVMPLLLTGAIFTSSIFENLGDKRKAIADLTLPASQLEKYLVGWFFSFLIYMILYTICFYVILSIVVSLDNWFGQEKQMMDLFSAKVLSSTFGTYALVHSITIYGSIYYDKGHFIKTGFVFAIFMLLLVLLNNQVMDLIFGREVNAFPFGEVSFLEDMRTWSVTAPENVSYWLNSVVPLFITLLMWIATYTRLKEKQV